MTKTRSKQLLIFIITIVIGSFFFFDLHHTFSLGYIQEQRNNWSQAYQQNPGTFSLAFAGIYILSTALALPIATVLTLLSGALFGFKQGLLIASFASSLGATAAFLIARFLLTDWVSSRYSTQLNQLHAAFKQEGPFYLFALRLVPLFPFFVINLLSALLPIKTWTFYWVSQLGMLAGTAVYVYAGTELGKLESLSGILSPKLFLSFSLLGLFPILSKKAVAWLRKRRSSNA